MYNKNQKFPESQVNFNLIITEKGKPLIAKNLKA